MCNLENLLVTANINEQKQRGDADSGGKRLVVVERLLEEHGKRERPCERERGEHGQHDEERGDPGGATLVELQPEVDEGAERGGHRQSEDDVVLFGAQSDAGEDDDDQLEHVLRAVVEKALEQLGEHRDVHFPSSDQGVETPVRMRFSCIKKEIFLRKSSYNTIGTTG